MAASKSFQLQQRGVALRMIAALCITVLVLTASLHLGAAVPRTVLERLIVTSYADVFVVCWLGATIGNVARLRFFSPDDIAGSGSGTATDKVSRANAILQNTLEQVALAIPVHVALTMLVASSMSLVVAFSALFCIGRLFFWIGYESGPESRAFGFALTFYPSVAGLVIALGAMARQSI